MAKDNDQPIYLISDLVYLAACGVSGYALLKDRIDLLNIGSFIAAGGSAIKALKVLSWITGNYKYYGGSYAGVGWHLIYLFGEIVGVAAFIMFGLTLTKKYEQQLNGKENVVIGLLAASAAAELLYPLHYFSAYTYNKAEFFKNYFTGALNLTSPVFLLAAYLLFLYLKLQLNRLPVQAAPVAKTVVPELQAATPAASTPLQKTNEEDNLELLRKYKELFDADIISKEEFDEKKKKILNL